MCRKLTKIKQILGLGERPLIKTEFSNSLDWHNTEPRNRCSFETWTENEQKLAWKMSYVCRPSPWSSESWCSEGHLSWCLFEFKSTSLVEPDSLNKITPNYVNGCSCNYEYNSPSDLGWRSEVQENKHMDPCVHYPISTLSESSSCSVEHLSRMWIKK